MAIADIDSDKESIRDYDDDFLSDEKREEIFNSGKWHIPDQERIIKNGTLGISYSK